MAKQVLNSSMQCEACLPKAWFSVSFISDYTWGIRLPNVISLMMKKIALSCYLLQLVVSEQF
jgi:hypothetical protein